MPSCCVMSCRARLRLFKFPRSIERRQAWLSSCEEHVRPTWVYTPNSVICQNHFDEDQFEQNRLDGFKKLKPFALPTVFIEKTKPEKPSKKRNHEGISDIANEKINPVDDKPLQLEQTEEADTVLSEIENLTYNGKLVLNNGSIEITLDCDIELPGNKESTPNNEKDHEIPREAMCVAKDSSDKRNHTFNEELTDNVKKQRKEASLEKETRLKCNVRQLESENRHLKNMLQNLEKFLHKDQIDFLNKVDSTESQSKWSKECILTCLKLKSILGWDGYNHLLSIGYPGPSKSTLSRHLQNYGAVLDNS